MITRTLFCRVVIVIMLVAVLLPQSVTIRTEVARADGPDTSVGPPLGRSSGEAQGPSVAAAQTTVTSQLVTVASNITDPSGDVAALNWLKPHPAIRDLTIAGNRATLFFQEQLIESPNWIDWYAAVEDWSTYSLLDRAPDTDTRRWSGGSPSSITDAPDSPLLPYEDLTYARVSQPSIPYIQFDWQFRGDIPAGQRDAYYYFDLNNYDYVVYLYADQVGGWEWEVDARNASFGLYPTDYEDIVSASVTEVGNDQLRFEMTVAGNIPQYTGPGNGHTWFGWKLNVDNNPATGQQPDGDDVNVVVRYESSLEGYNGWKGVIRKWNGTQYEDFRFVPFARSGNTMSTTVDISQLGLSPVFRWRAETSVIVNPGYAVCPSDGDFFTTADLAPDSGWVEMSLTSRPSLSISHVEVTQAIQDETNSTPLIAGKPTLVRVYVDCTQDCNSVTGVLNGFGSSGELRNSPLAPNGSIAAEHVEDWREQRGDLDKTLSFTLPTEWLEGTVLLQAEIQTADGVKASGIEVTFQPTASVNALFVPVRYDGTEPSSPLVLSSESAFWAQRVWPTTRVYATTQYALEWSPGPLCQSSDCREEKLESWLTNVWRNTNGNYDFIVGWISKEKNDDFDGKGSSDPSYLNGDNKAAFVIEHSTDAPLIFAHEVGHLLGRRHTNSVNCNPIDPKSKWPYKVEHSWIKPNYGLDLTGPEVKSPTHFDYMSTCGTLAAGGNAWTSVFTYKHIYSETLKLQTTTLTEQVSSASQFYFVASGLVFADDTVVLDPIWVITSATAPTNSPLGTGYCLESQDASGSVLVSHCFDLSFIDYETFEPTDVAGFNLMLPYSSDVARIILKKGSQELATRLVSENAPVVTVLSPNGGETWAGSGTYTINWTATDSDGDPIAYNVLYSPNVSTWIPLGINITETQLTVAASELPGGNEVRVRVVASDGVNTATDESDAPFTVERKGPQVHILSPDGGAVIPPGTAIYLQGFAYDLEDGTLEESALRWTSSWDGDLGTGSLARATLSRGEHAISLIATDSDGNPAQATVNVFVGIRKTYLPTIFKNYTSGSQPSPPANNPPNMPSNPSPFDGATGQSVNVNLSWTGGDPDGDSVIYGVYFEANDTTPDVLICNDVSSPACDPGTLNHDTHYYWQVVARDSPHGVITTGPVWDFTTAPSPGWYEVGAGSASGGGISNNSGVSRFPWMTVAPDGTRYITWHDNSGGDYEIYVRRWNGSSWGEVGAGSASGGGISNNSGDSRFPLMAIAPDGTPYVTWQDNSGGDNEIYVRRWNGSNWVEVGAGSASGGGISNNSSDSRYPRIDTAPDGDGTPYIAWQDNGGGDNEIYVRRWNGSSWGEVGAGSASGGGISNNSGDSKGPSVSVALDGTPYAMWRDDSSGNYEIYVRRWNGSSWGEVGAGSATGGGISNNSGTAGARAMAIAPDGTPYIAWRDDTGGNDEIYVRRWNGSSWGEVGSGSAIGRGISNNSGVSRDPSVAIAPDGTPYIAWQDNSGGDDEIYIRRWNGGSWGEVGAGSASGGGISNNSGDSARPSITIGPDSTLYAAWSDNSSGDYEIYVLRRVE